MKLFPEKKAPQSEVQVQESRYHRYSRRAIENMHDFARWRVMQLEHHGGVLNFLASFGGELEDLFNLASRIERVEINHNRFQKMEQELLYEIIRRQQEE